MLTALLAIGGTQILLATMLFSTTALDRHPDDVIDRAAEVVESMTIATVDGRADLPLAA